MVFHEVFSASLERYFSHRLQSREVQAPVPHVMAVARGLGTFWEPLVLLSRGSGTGKSNCGHPGLHVLRLGSHKLLNRGSVMGPLLMTPLGLDTGVPDLVSSISPSFWTEQIRTVVLRFWVFWKRPLE